MKLKHILKVYITLYTIGTPTSRCEAAVLLDGVVPLFNARGYHTDNQLQLGVAAAASQRVDVGLCAVLRQSYTVSGHNRKRLTVSHT